MNEIDHEELQETIKYRNKILAQWHSLDNVERSMEILNNSLEYRLAAYAETTPIEEQEYYMNSEGNLTTWTLDPTVTMDSIHPSIQKLTLSDFVSKPRSSSFVADKLI